MSSAFDDLFDGYDWENAVEVGREPAPAGGPGPVEDLGSGAVSATEPKPPSQAKQPPIPLTREDAHNADYLEAEFGVNVRFDHPTGRWYLWHKGAHRWRKDENESVRLWTDNAARRRARDAVNNNDMNALKIATALFSVAKQEAALKHLRFHGGIAIGQQHWDMEPELFCVRNGVIDLPTGTFRDGRQIDHITKQSPVVYDPTAECPRWMQFLREVFVTDELIEYVRTMVGYCMTGLTLEQAWFLLYGTGGNGKSVFISVLEALFAKGEYYEQASADTFVLTNYGPSASHNIAQLRGARLVVASEVSEKAAFDGARIKQLTGGDPVTAAAKYENNVTFVPQLKLMMLVNHLPTTRDDSLGFWRRLRAIPFDVTFTNPDVKLLDTLLAELPGILNWALGGAREWFASGLAPVPGPAAALVEEYRAESDPLAMFIHECILVTKNASDMVPAREMYQTYVKWSAGTKHSALSETNFGRAPSMKTLGLGKRPSHGGTFYFGVKAFDPDAPNPVKMPRRTTTDD